MTAFFSSIIATFVTIPLLGYIIVFIVSKLITKKHRKSIGMALDVTTLLLIICVHYLIMAIWEISLLWLIFIILILTAAAFVVAQWKVKHDIHLTKVFKGFWRFNFLLFSFVYFALLIYGLILRVSLSVS
ncbi:DUF3397 domain-containing protein [Bacillus benzoevorans]|uniref:DUF3397 domain-containing protein n=1 Tax=Bacillus benzoevorans TaxID=1456 RepID=A0A7X0HMX7_9BACI|nr:DUF3397 domain-containing protein [Bacillus benzoevorans]MBB6443734.1 hypothetical protein [Bacillus benzoevorans]